MFISHIGMWHSILNDYTYFLVVVFSDEPPYISGDRKFDVELNMLTGIWGESTFQNNNDKFKHVRFHNEILHYNY